MTNQDILNADAPKLIFYFRNLKWYQFYKRSLIRDMMFIQSLNILNDIKENTKRTAKSVKAYNDSIHVKEYGF